MWTRTLLALLACLLTAGAGRAAGGLTETEAKWVRAGLPVLKYAREQGLPVDVIVQPDDEPDASPIALGIQDGRCKLVVSMRGNPGSAALAADVAPGLFNAVAEAVFAHEIGHCWRYLRGTATANTPQAGFSADDGTPEGDADERELAQLALQMHARQQEEGFADLVGLAWTLRAHRGQYPQVRDWLLKLRANPSVPGEHHDTGAWLRLAAEASEFGESATVFGQVQGLWERGQRPLTP